MKEVEGEDLFSFHEICSCHRSKLQIRTQLLEMKRALQVHIYKTNQTINGY